MTTTRRILAALVLSAIALVGFASVASAATPSKTTTKTTWNAAHTIKTTDSHTVRATGTTHTVTMTKYAPKVKKVSQVKLSAHKVSESISTRKDGSVSHKITTTDTVYNKDGSVKSETQTAEVLS
jgi:hypothetical protein